MNKRGLGRGLDALLGGVSTQNVSDDRLEIPVDEILPNRFQPRKEFDPERLAELVESLKQYGVLQPIVVRRHEQGFELVAGERRWRASQQAGLQTIPAIVRDYSDMEMTAVALVENLQRENLNPIEEAQAYRRLIEEFGFTQEEVSQRIGKSRSFIANTVRLLNLPTKIQEHVSRGTMSPGQARPLLVLSTPEIQVEAASEIISRSMTARDAEDLSRKLSRRGSVKVKPVLPKQEETVDLRQVEEQLATLLATRVRLVPRENGQGVIEIEYYSSEDLQRIFEKVSGINTESAEQPTAHNRNTLPV